MMSDKLAKSIAYFSSGFLQGMCLVTFPAASMIFKSPEANGISDGQYGFAFLAQIFAAVAACLLMKRLLSVFGKKKIYLTGLLANAFYLACLWLTLHTHGRPQETFLLLFIANGFLGTGFGFTISVMNLCVVELYPKHKDAAVAGLHGLLGIGAALTPLLINHFHEQGNWATSILLTFCLVGLLVAVELFSRLVPSETLEPHQNDCTKNKRSWDLGLVLFLILLIFYGSIESIFGNWTTTYLLREKTLSLSAASVALSLFWGFLTVGRLLASVLTLKIQPEHLYRIAPLLMVASLATLTRVQTQEAVWITYVFIGLGCAGIYPLSLSLSIARYPQHKEVLSSVSLAALMVGVGIGSSGTGFVQMMGWADLGKVFVLAVGFACLIGIATFYLAGIKPAEEPL